MMGKIRLKTNRFTRLNPLGLKCTRFWRARQGEKYRSSAHEQSIAARRPKPMWYIVDQMLAGGYARTIHKLENAGFGTFLAEPPCTKVITEAQLTHQLGTEEMRARPPLGRSSRFVRRHIVQAWTPARGRCATAHTPNVMYASVNFYCTIVHLQSSRIRDHSSPAAYTYTLVSNMTQRHRIFNSPPY